MRIDEFTELTLTVQRGVGVITLNRPERRNTWGGRTAVEYRWALHHCHTAPEIRVVVLAGNGDFCAGADTGALDRIERAGGRYQPERLPLPPYPDGTPEGWRHNHLYPLTISTPVLAAISGGCAGAGFVLATYADLRFAAADCRISSSFASLGLPAEYGIGWLLPRQVGLPDAMRLLYDARVIDAAEAHRLGWVQQVCEPARLLDETRDYAERLARESSAEALRMMKRALLVDAVGDISTAYERSVRDMNDAMRHPDFREGLAARKEKRPANFL